MKKLNELTIIEARNGLINKDFTSQELVKACLMQIHAYDPKVNAYVTVLSERDLLKQAREADKKILKDGKKAFEKQPLIGIPYAAKDNFSTEGIETTASSNILKGYVPPYESTVTLRLKNAGAILLGKTNLDAFAHGASTETSDFFSTKNPWDVTRIPGGSSGGSAAAVAANMCIFAVGSDTGGSIRCPASWCGITGLKPTYGRVSRYGVIAMASSTDSPGPMTKTVEDTALVLAVIAGKDDLDATSSPKEVEDYAAGIKNVSLKGLKIGVAESFFVKEMEKGVSDAVRACIAEFEGLGANIQEVELLDPKFSLAVYTVIQRSEVSSNLARFDGIRYGHERTAFGPEARKRMMLGAYALSSGYYDAYYTKAQKVRTVIVEEFRKSFNNVDLIIGPTLPTVAQKLGATETLPMFGEITDNLQFPAAMAGLCSIAIPAGFSEGLPVGVQLMGPQFSETLVLGASYQYQLNSEIHKKFPDLSYLDTN